MSATAFHTAQPFVPKELKATELQAKLKFLRMCKPSYKALALKARSPAVRAKYEGLLAEIEETLEYLGDVTQ